jgi:hypothetical protein
LLVPGGVKANGAEAMTLLLAAPNAVDSPSPLVAPTAGRERFAAGCWKGSTASDVGPGISKGAARLLGRIRLMPADRMVKPPINDDRGFSSKMLAEDKGEDTRFNESRIRF